MRGVAVIVGLTQNFYGLTSLSSVLLGGSQAVFQDSGTTSNSTQMFFPQSSVTTGRPANGNVIVPFPTAYLTTPTFVQIGPVAAESFSYAVVASTATNFTVSVNTITVLGGNTSIAAFTWLAVGQIALP